MKKAIATKKAPAAIGPYSQAIQAGQVFFCAGQIHIDPNTGALVTGDISKMTKRVMDNLKAVLEEAGAGMEHVVKTTVYMTDLADFPKMNETYATYFKEPYPARATVQVAALPKGARIEIEAMAVVPVEYNHCGGCGEECQCD